MTENQSQTNTVFLTQIKVDRVGVEPTTTVAATHSIESISSLYYFHSYAVILNCLDSGSNSDSSAIIKLFIQDNFCEFVNPVTMIKPLTFPPSTTLPFPCAHHMNWLPPSAVVISEPWLLWSTMP